MGTNILLIGMPGCGKTTFGSKLGKLLKMDFIDLDKYIEEKEGTSISSMFSISEEYFRSKESQYLKEMMLLNKTIISTGGGIIKSKSNIDVMHSCGYVVFIHRTPENILTDVDIYSRPLLQDNKNRIYTLYDERIGLYESACDFVVDNNGPLEDTLKELIKLIKAVELL